MRTYDAIVVGLGAMGASATYQLAKAGADVLGIDRHHPPHAHGSTHGETRITRLAIGEGVQYVPLVKRSHELWREIEAASGESLFTQTGMIVIGAHRAAPLHGADDFLAATVEAARAHAIDHELLDARAMQERFPQFALTGDERGGYYEPAAGYVRPERAVATQLRLAEREHGATLRTGERVTNVDGGRVTTDRGEYAAATVVLAAGPWIGDFVPDRFTIHRQVLFWFETTTPELHERMPIFIWDLGGGPDDFVYGFPAIDGARGGVKVASEDHTQATTAEACDRTVTRQETTRFHERYVNDRLNGLTDRCLKTTTCLYTVTADRGFVIGPRDDHTILVSPCSGHGFKHSAAIGEIVAQQVTRGRSDLDVSAFAP